MKCLPLISLAALLPLLVVGCSIKPPLYLRSYLGVEVEVQARIDVDILWQVDWQTAWEFNWNEERLGPVGYTTPSGVRMHIYTQGADGLPHAHREYNFHGNSARMEIFEGTHNLLFHNNDSEALLFRTLEEGNDLSDVLAYTRNISSGLKKSEPVFTLQQKAMGMTKADDLEEEPVSLPPDGLFSVYEKGRVLTADPNDYIMEDGRYVLRIESVLTPATFIYLFQVRLLNNNGRVIGSDGGAAITGMAGGVNLVSREPFSTTVSVPMDVHFDRTADLMGARVLSFGHPSGGEKTHYFVLSVTYLNGGYRNIRIDVTDKVRALPTGGVITLELDVDDFPPGEAGSGGFNALIDGWDEETGHITIK